MNLALKRVQELSLPLLGGVVAALLFANLAPHAYHEVVHFELLGTSLHFLVNDVFMALFFGLAAKEIVESLLPGGALHPLKKAVNPLLATLGGVLGPIVAYFGVLAFQGRWDIATGWGVPTATDIALAWLVARLAFGASHPAVSFLLLLAVADDAIGLVIIAVFYPDPAHPAQPVWLLLVAAAVLGAWYLRKRDVQSFWAYLAGPGMLSWWGLHAAHLHPALALVAVVPFMPHARHDAGLFAEYHDDHVETDTLNRFEHAFRLPVDFGLFFFGLCNAGVTLGSVGSATWAVLVALVVGKTLGIFVFASLGGLLGFPLPDGMDRRSVALAGLTASLGLTVALFVAGVAFVDAGVRDAAKMGALLSVGVAPVVVLLARVARVRKLVDRARETLRPIAFSEHPPPAE
ncbi:MAG: Na+/H+ antiporter NhaA [Sandaracinus sp.]|nr:Na+/H+ antiporter NhaA [Sandaracinus sp.]MCB9632484.1 Na+/H+ antiporter NhaA [Sandaracinus sp.]